MGTALWGQALWGQTSVTATILPDKEKVGQKGQYSGGLLGKKIGILYMGAASNSCVVPEVDPWVDIGVVL